jgi:hypothetical protein
MNDYDINKYLVCLKKFVRYPSTIFSNIDIYKANKIGSLYSVWHYVRLAASFEAAILLIRNGFYIEANTIFRLVYEQLCYCIELFDKSAEDLNSIKVTKSIKSIKKLNPKYKNLYGYLSSLTHLNIDDIVYNCVEDLCLKIDNKNRIQINVIQKENELNKTNILLLSCLLIIFYEVALYLLSQSNTNNELIVKKLKKKYSSILTIMIDIKKKYKL